MATVGCLYLVATPIGNLADITLRALEVLKSVDVIAAEDTRHSKKLCSHYGINTALTSLHEHNEKTKTRALMSRLEKGQNIALVSDAGTPLVCDPGENLVATLAAAGINIIPVPGACAAIAALTASGLACDRFLFVGFLPARGSRRKKCLQALRCQTPSLIFYESVHRVQHFIDELIVCFGEHRQVVLARELTKQFETITRCDLLAARHYLEENPERLKGEFVVVLEGASEEVAAEPECIDSLLRALVQELSPSRAASIVAKVFSLNKKDLYERALSLKGH